MGFSKTYFSIEVNFANVQYFILTPGVVTEKIHLEANHPLVEEEYSNVAFFRYNHFYDSSYRLIIAKSQGQITIGINKLGNTSYWMSQGLNIFDHYLPYYNNTAPALERKFHDRLFGGIIFVDNSSDVFCSSCS